MSCALLFLYMRQSHGVGYVFLVDRDTIWLEMIRGAVDID